MKKKLNLDEVLSKVVALLQRHHPKDLNFSKVARFTKVARPTLYYYFGNQFEDLLAESVRFGMKRYMLMTRLEAMKSGVKKTPRSFSELQLQRLRSVIAIVRKYPWSTQLYFRYRTEAGKLGETMFAIERTYIEEWTKAFEKIEGRKPDELAARLSGYVKLGLLWGLSIHSDYWFKKVPRKDLEAAIRAISEVAVKTIYSRIRNA